MIATANKRDPLVILVAEDNDDDVELLSMGFRKAAISIDLRRVKDGEECLAFLRQQNEYANAPEPALVLLDLNMPRMSGREMLAEAKQDLRLRHIPIIILSTSSDKEEINRMYDLRCNSYVVKPVSLNQLACCIQGIMNYWLTIAELPSS